MKRILSLVLITFLHGLSVYSQDIECATTVTDEQIEFMKSIHSSANINQMRGLNNQDVSVPLKFHIINRSNGSGGLNPARITPLIQEVNASFVGLGITFFQTGDVNIINNDQYYNLDFSQEGELANSRDVRNVVNIYVSGTLTSGSSSLCGYTYLPPSADRVFLALGCTANDYQTTAHELGHYLSLFHTHGKTNTGTTDELVQRVNCENFGDNLCDTPADPNLSGNVGGGCVYTGSATDANGDLFNPDTRNLMAYSPNSCRNKFSLGQLNRMSNGLLNGRSYLNLTFSNFTANFTVNERSGCAPLTIQFTDNTLGSVSRTWEFEGANVATSTNANPTVTFDEPGIYAVKLIARNAGGAISERQRTDYIIVEDVFQNVIQDTTFNSFIVNSLPVNWSIKNLDQLETFNFSNVSYDGQSNSLQMNNYEYNSLVVPQIDELEMSNFGLEEVKSFNIKFNYAYTFIPEDFANGIIQTTDSLEIGYRLECDDEFISIFKSGGDQLKTAPPTNSAFEPQGSEEWGTIDVKISKADIIRFDEKQVIRPVLRNICMNGNNLFIDNVELIPDFTLDSIQSFRVSNQLENEITLRWFNPAINESGIQIERSVDGVNFSVIDEVPKNQTEFTDSDIPENATFLYYRAVNFNSKAKSSYTPIIEVPLIVTSNKVQIDDLNSILIYPNPTVDGIVNISGNCDEISNISRIKIFSVTGQLQTTLNNSEIHTINGDVQFSIGKLHSGMYFVELDGVNLCDKLFRIIKK